MRLYVGGLPYQTDEQELRDVFGQIGNVTFATVITDRETGRSKGFGFVEFEDDDQARAAIDQLNGSMLGNRTITVNEARERPAGGGNRGGGYNDRGGQGGGYRGGRY
ncbi:hypothetical protein KDW_52980 [Dictyobacter vulcani]|uniref:RRM domain-containing protein n=1 Tax=Dictyobacter vulcani TaxID=2607529 RepID=A0A5J4L0Z7_9CHLR|nr:RNA-binding protein [Dictyobacter vulcani]GER91136.1 hypothetical protein KDW_52980 [Dictyobacter vulcani]